MTAAVCLVVRNEGASIREWLAWHHIQGFAAAIVFDHASTDDTLNHLREAQRTQDVRIHPIRCDGNRSSRHQTDAYMRACDVYGDEFEWMCMVDADELLIVPGGVRDWLTRFDPDVAQVSIPWAIFGSSGHVVKPSGLMCESYTNRALASFEPCRHVKSFVRPRLVGGWPTPHAAWVHGRTVRSDESPMTWGKVVGYDERVPDYADGQVNHYFVRSRQHWEERLARPGGVSRTWTDFEVYDRGEVRDLIAFCKADAVRRQMATTVPWTLARELEQANG